MLDSIHRGLVDLLLPLDPAIFLPRLVQVRRKVILRASLSRQSAKEKVEWRSDDTDEKDSQQPGEHGAAGLVPGAVDDNQDPDCDSRQTDREHDESPDVCEYYCGNWIHSCLFIISR